MTNPIYIAIPSYKRPNGVKTLLTMPPPLRERTVLFVNEDEVEAYRQNYKTVRVHNCGPAAGIASKRQKMVEIFKGKRLWMIDDDLQFGETSSLMHGEYHQCVFDQPELSFAKAYRAINVLFDCGAVIGGVTQHTFPFRDDAWPTVIFPRQYTNMFLDLSDPKLQTIDWTAVNTAEDFLALATACSKGIVPISTTFVCGVFHKTGAEGGCQTWRTAKMYNRDCMELKRRFPEMSVFQGQKEMGGEMCLSLRTNFKRIFKANGGDLEAAKEWQAQVNKVLQPWITNRPHVPKRKKT